MGEKKERPHYPWQIPIASRFPASQLSEAERGRQDCEFFYLFERLLMEEGCESELVYDEEHNAFRYPNGRFALSRESTPTGLVSQSHRLLRRLGTLENVPSKHFGE